MMSVRKKILLSFFLILLAFSFLIMALLPTIISTEWGKNQLLQLVNKKIPGKLEIASASFSWFGPQSINDLSLKDTTDKSVLSVKSFTTNSPLISLIRHLERSGKTEIQGLNLTIEEEQPGHTNLHNALGNTYLPYRLEHASRTPLFISLEGVDASFDFPHGALWPSANAQGHTKYGNMSGEFQFESGADGTVTTMLSHFPVALIDHLVSMQNPQFTGLPRATLGEILDLSLTHKLIPKGCQFELKAKSNNLTAAFSGLLVDDKILLDRDGTATFTLTPELVTLLSEFNKSVLPIQLQKPVQATLTIDKLAAPISYFTGKEKRLDIAVAATLTIPNADIAGGEKMGTIGIRQFQSTLNAAEDNKTATVILQGEISDQGNPVQLKLNATIEKPANINSLMDAVQKQMNVKLEINGVPTMLTDQVETLQISGEMHGTPLRRANYSLVADLKPNPKGSLVTALGKNGQVRVETTLIDMSKWNPIKIDIASDLLQCTVRGEIHDNWRLKFTSPAEIKYLLTPEIFDKFGVDPDLLKLQQPSSLFWVVYPSTSSIHLQDIAEGKLSSLQMAGKMEALSLEFVSQQHDDISIEKLALPWEVNGRSKRLEMNLDGYMRLIKDAGGTLNGKILLTDWANEAGFNFDGAALNANIALGKLPVVFFAAMAPQQATILKLIGTRLDVNFEANIFPLGKREGTMEIAFQGEELKGNVGIKVGKEITLKNPAQPITIQATLTPNRFSALRELLGQNSNGSIEEGNAQETLELIEPTEMITTIRKMNIPLEGPKTFIPHELIADLVIDDLKIKRPHEFQTISLNGLTAHFDSKNLAKKMVFHIEGDEKASPTSSNPFYASGVVENFFTDAGEINVKGLSLSFEAKSKRLPASLFCQIACLNEDTRNRLEALFGETFEVDLKAQLKRMNGPVQASVKGQNGRLKLDAQLNNGIAKLNSPFEIEIEVTPKLGKSILEEILPVVSGVVAAENPVKISIDPKGFVVPIYPFTLSDVKIQNATIELGKMIFSNKGDLGDVFDLLKPSSRDQLSVWFTPLYLSMENGILRLNRMDMLMVNRFPLALWGKVDTTKDKVDMRIGISGTALSHALNEDIDPDVMLQIPLTGTMSNANIDKAKAATRISAAVAQSKGGAHGLLIGAFLDIAGGSLAEERPPAPTTNPLPWEELIDTPSQKKRKNETASHDNTPSKKEKKSEKKKKIGRQLEEAAGSIVDSLFH